MITTITENIYKDHPSHIYPSEWAMKRFGYSKARRSAFWQWAKANGLPFIKLSERKAVFSIHEIEKWESLRGIARPPAGMASR